MQSVVHRHGELVFITSFQIEENGNVFSSIDPFRIYQFEIAPD